MDKLVPHLDKLIRETRLLWGASKLFILGNLTIFVFFSLWGDESMIYRLLRHQGHYDEMLISVMAGFALFLYTDLCRFDFSKFARRHWYLERFVPIVYMLMGFGYLALSFAASAAFFESWPLVVTYLFNAGMAGVMAFLTRLRLSWSTNE